MPLHLAVIQLRLGDPIPIAIFASTHDDLPPWANYGILGLVIVAIITRQLVAGWQYADMKAERDRLQEDNKALVQQLLANQEATLPALKEATTAVSEALTEIRILRQYNREGP